VSPLTSVALSDMVGGRVMRLQLAAMLTAPIVVSALRLADLLSADTGRWLLALSISRC
jgi:hypothetical protein